MSTTTVSAAHPHRLLPAGVPELARRLAPGATVLALHAAAIYALQAGLGMPPTPEPRKEITAMLIAPVVPPVTQTEPPKPQPAPRKTVAVQPRPAPAPVVPVLQNPSPTALTAPPQPAPVQAQAAPSPVAAVEPAPVPAPPAPAPAPPKTISSGVEYVREPQVEYPAAARRRGNQGVVVLRVLVNEKGIAEQIEVQKSSGFPSIDEAGKRAVQRALFKPYIDNGKATPVYALIPINFQLDI